MTSRERLEQLFRERGIAYEVTAHPEVYTAQEVAAVEHVTGYGIAKVVVAAVDGKIVLLVLPAPHRVDLEKLRLAAGAKEARLAREEEFSMVFPDCEVGAMPPFGNLYGVPVYVDLSFVNSPRITFNAGTHRETMTVAYGDFERIAQPKVADFSVPAAATPPN